MTDNGKIDVKSIITLAPSEFDMEDVLGIDAY
jgi:hypothetical protein